MNEPIFQDFTKEIINPLYNPNKPQFTNINTLCRINKEEEGVEQLIIRRNKENMGFFVFTILCKNNFDYSNTINFIKEVSNLSPMSLGETRGSRNSNIEEITFDVTSNFEKIFDTIKNNKNKIYLINLHNDKNNYDIYPEAFSLFIMNLFKICGSLQGTGGIIFVTDSIDKTPQLALTLSELVFIQNIPEYSNNMQELFFKSCFYKLKPSIIDNLDMICVDKLSLWTKIKNFSKY